MNTENAILGQYGLLFIFLNDAEWEALPGNLLTAAIAAASAIPGGAAAVAAAPTVYRDRNDFTTPVPRPANNAANAVLKDFELQTNQAIKAGTFRKRIQMARVLLRRIPCVAKSLSRTLCARSHSLTSRRRH
jgi:hypothetical protein